MFVPRVGMKLLQEGQPFIDPAPAAGGGSVAGPTSDRGPVPGRVNPNSTSRTTSSTSATPSASTSTTPNGGADYRRLEMERLNHLESVKQRTLEEAALRERESE